MAQHSLLSKFCLQLDRTAMTASNHTQNNKPKRPRSPQHNWKPATKRKFTHLLGNLAFNKQEAPQTAIAVSKPASTTTAILTRGASLSGYLHANSSHQRTPSSTVSHRHIYADVLSAQPQKTQRAFSCLDDCCLGADDRQKGISSLHTQPETLYTTKTLKALLRLQKISTLS